MQLGDLDAVLAVERSAYAFPWTRGNFVDSLAAGYRAELLEQDRAGLVGYSLAMAGVDEMHLLNLTVAPAMQGRGHARTLLDALERHCLQLRLPRLWLEVRAGNAGARRLYMRRGFVEAGLRRGYYPAAKGQREDAVVMSLDLRGR
jgi:ribosomal-protein-alanine N-acetyltransferase